MSKCMIPTSKFPFQRLNQYQKCRVLLSDKDTEISDWNNHLAYLESDFKLMESSQEYQKIPYISEAIEHCHREINKINSTQVDVEENEDLVDFEEKKRVHNKKAELKKNQ